MYNDELKNVTLYVNLGDNKTYGEILQHTLESSNIPDIVLKYWPKQIENYATAGSCCHLVITKRKCLILSSKAVKPPAFAMGI